jgi:hypothetical protein
MASCFDIAIPLFDPLQEVPQHPDVLERFSLSLAPEHR